MCRSTEARAKKELSWQEQRQAAKLLLQPTNLSTVQTSMLASVLSAAKKVTLVALLQTATWLALQVLRVDVFHVAPKKLPKTNASSLGLLTGKASHPPSDFWYLARFFAPDTPSLYEQYSSVRSGAKKSHYALKCMGFSVCEL
jgi:hypothetical protein